MDIQAQLDQWLASSPEAQQYITKAWYVPDGTAPPADVTQTLTIRSPHSPERHLMIGLVVKPQYAVMVDAILAMVATQ